MTPTVGLWRYAYCAHYRVKRDGRVERRREMSYHRPTWALFMSDADWSARPEFRPAWVERKILGPDEWHPFGDA